MIAVYGPGVLRLPALAQLQLWQNLERQRKRRAAPVCDGVAAALTPGDLDDSWFESLTDTPEGAQEMRSASKSARDEARARARLGWGA